MEKKVAIKNIGILTSGGDAPGMNAAIRALTRFALSEDMIVYGIERGYNGLIDAAITRLDSRSVSDKIQKGGTFLKTARCEEFLTYEGRKRAYDVLKAYDIDALVVIGGDGSFRGMWDLKKDFNFPVIGIPGTIDNDLAYTDYTLGFDTAVNTVLWAINNLRDTMSAHDRVCIVEVMGRHCGDIAVYSGLAGGAELMLVPENPIDVDLIGKRLLTNQIKGKSSAIIVVAEGAMSAADLKQKIKEKFDLSLRTIQLGHIQRGGTPTMADRVLAARFADHAITLLKQGKTGRLVGIKGNKIIDVGIEEGLAVISTFDADLYRIANTLGAI